MSDWWDETWNPWEGCDPVSEGCDNCYMFRIMRQFGKDPTVVRRTANASFTKPLRWAGAKKVFVCSMSDFFHRDANRWRDEAWQIIRRCPHLAFIIPSKRAAQIAAGLPEGWGRTPGAKECWPNVWLGVSVENAETLWRVDTLLKIPAAVRFISYEPALGPVDLTPSLRTGEIHWVIAGGESDYHHPRPADPDWFRSMRDQCAEYGVAYFHKQHGGTRKIGESWGGHVLDGKTHHAFPTARESAPLHPAQREFARTVGRMAAQRLLLDPQILASVRASRTRGGSR